MNDLSSPLRQALDRELRLGERIVWSQQPPPLALARKYFKSFLFGIPFCAFAIFWTIGASGGFGGTKSKDAPPSWFPMVWGGMFIIAGLCMMLNPFWACWKAFKTIYAITDQRALIIEARWPRKVRSFIGDTLANIDRIESEDGTGDITFYRPEDAKKRTESYHGLGFVGIQRVKEVEDLLRKLYETTRSPSVPG